jgi:hypothetical protein
MDFTETFYLTILATGAGILTLIIKKMSQSKCDEINCWGIKIHRRVDLETNDDISEEDKAKGIRI